MFNVIMECKCYYAIRISFVICSAVKFIQEEKRLSTYGINLYCTIFGSHFVETQLYQLQINNCLLKNLYIKINVQSVNLYIKILSNQL